MFLSPTVKSRNSTSTKRLDKPLGTSPDDLDGALLIPPPIPQPGDSDPPLFTNTTEADYNATVTSISHDFTDCCERHNVSTRCIGFCNVHNILEGTTGIEPEACEKDFSGIVKCMADGRNHIPCCEDRGIPDICQDMCRGEYTPFTDFLKSRVSCVRHTLPGLQCIMSGIQRLPSSPEDIYAEPLTEKSLKVGWSPPIRLADTVKYYLINVTALMVFDEDAPLNRTKLPAVSVKVPKNLDSTVISDLQPFTMYSIIVTAYNEHGSSLPSYRIRALTLDNGINKQTSVATVPKLPDVKECCQRNGMTHRTCLDKMCDPKKTDLADVPDFMICAPWSNITFACLANNIDHSPCCRARGIPKICLPLCNGTVTHLDFSLFK